MSGITGDYMSGAICDYMSGTIGDYMSGTIDDWQSSYPHYLHAIIHSPAPQEITTQHTLITLSALSQ